MSDPEQWATFDQIGVDEVRKRLALGRYDSRTRPIVEEWLRRKDQERETTVKREAISIARTAASAALDSADAARDAADKARRANTIARVAIAIAAIAAIISIIGIYSNWFLAFGRYDFGSLPLWAWLRGRF